MILLTMTILSFVTINQSVSAEVSLTTEPPVNTGGLWHVEEGNRVYVYMRYTHDNDGSVIETGNFPAGVKDYLPSVDDYALNNQGYDYSLYTYWPDFSEGNFSFPNTSLYNDYSSISNPNPALYDTFKVEIISGMTSEYRSYRGAPEFKEIASYTEAINTVAVRLFDKADLTCFHDYSYLQLEIDGVEVLSSRQLTDSTADNCNTNDGTSLVGNPNYEDLAFGVRMYWEKSETATEIDPGGSTDPWSLLPETSAAPSNPFGDWGTVSNINENNNRISFDIKYQGITYPVLPFSVDGDLDFIGKSNDILYYTDPTTGDRILYFNFGETLDSAILAARSFDDISVWKGEALWNLTKNEIKVTDVLKVYNYIPEVDSDGNVYSYFYMPDVPIDRLISVSGTLAYRYWDRGFLNLGDLEPGEIQYKVVAAVDGETTSVNPNWVEDTYKGAYITGALTTVATISGVFPGYGWAVAGGCFLVGGALHVSDVNEWWAYDVEQIEHVIPNISLTNEINAYISSINSDDQFTADTDKLYKLHLATLNEGDEAEIMDSLSNVTQVVWETDGRIYMVNEENIDDYWFGPGTLEPVNTSGNDDLQMIIYIGAGIVGLWLFVKLKLDKKPGLVIILIGGILYVLYKMGLF